MKIKLLVIGKTDDKFLVEGIKKYQSRLKHYLSFEFTELPDIKNSRSMTQEKQKELEGEILQKHLKPGDRIVVLDEKGKNLTSREFASYIEKNMISGVKRVVFIIGGPFGFSDNIYSIANDKISLSKMTFSHQLVRLIFFEQIYRAMTIIRNEPYHHD